MQRTILILLIMLAFHVLSFGNEVEVLKDRLKTELQQKAFSKEEVASVLASQQTDGSWTDIDYKDKSATQWLPTRHLNRLQLLSMAYSVKGQSYFGNQKLLEGILKGLDFWYIVNPRSSNWWQNDIGKQNILAPIAFLLVDKLSKNQLQNIINDLPIGTRNLTGQNKLWFSEEMIWRGCLAGDGQLIKSGADSLKSVVKMFTSEGIMPDYSFRQHGPQLYAGGYGSPFLVSNIQWAYRLRQLSFAYSKENIDLLRNFIAEGSLWMIRRNYWDFQTVGRNIARKANGEVRIGNHQNASLNGVLRQFSVVDTANQETYMHLAKHIEGTNDNVLTGNKYYYWSDFMVHRRPNYYFSVRMNSIRTTRTEQGNNENVKGDYLSDGGTTILLDGNEYVDVFPCWNWSQVPGVTSPLRATPKSNKNWGIPGVSDYTGGVSDGKYGVAVYQQNWDSTQVKKAWFMFENEIVCLATDIKSNASTEISTTLNQTNLKDKVWIKETGKKAYQFGSNSTKKIISQWIWHGKTGYYLVNPTMLIVSSQKITGDWSTIGAYPKGTLETKNVLTISKSHGFKPEGSSFAYIVVPGMDKAHFEKYNLNAVQILANNDSLQAVQNKALKMYGLVLHKAQTVTLNNNVTISANQKCILLLKNVNGKYSICLADPTQKLTNVHISLTLSGKIQLDKEIQLPQGDFKGSTIKITN